jgi:hypothetical protein
LIFDRQLLALLIAGSILGNNQILCGNVVSTYYVLTPMKDSTHPLRDGIAYVVHGRGKISYG